MSRLAIPTREGAPAASQPILDAVDKQLGVVPNLFRLAANSPTALAAMTGLGETLGKVLDVKTRNRIAITTAQANGCDYCLSAHTYLGLNLAKLSPEEIALNRKGGSHDAKADAAVRFASVIAHKRGQVSDAEIAAVRAAGYGDAQIVDIVAVVAHNFFTNLLNNVARTDIDFPVFRTAEAA
jgi:uncharacterized peroxidase-related enzyme